MAALAVLLYARVWSPDAALALQEGDGAQHVTMEHVSPDGGSRVPALVLVRRLDGENLHAGGPGVVGDRFGVASAAADMDGDGVLDLIVGAPRADASGSSGTNEGRVYVFSGAALLAGADQRAALLYAVDGEPTANGTGELGFRQSVDAADFDGDGYPELALGAWLGDPVAGGRTQVDGGSLFVLSGRALLAGASRDDALLFRLDGEAGARLGRPSVVVGDINRDGVPDLFVGAHRASPGGLHWAGSGYLISGVDFSVLHRFDGHSENDFLGRSIMAPGDLDGDGYPDLVVGASQGDGGQVFEASSFGPGYVNVYSGRDFSVIARLSPPEEEPSGAFGQTTVYNAAPLGSSDLDGDAVPEIIVGSPEARAGRIGPPGKEGQPRTGSVYVFSGRDFALLYRLDGERATEEVEALLAPHEAPASGAAAGNIGDVFGDAVAVIPDIDGDGLPDLLVGSPRGDGRRADGSPVVDAGYVKIFSGRAGALLGSLSGETGSANMGHHVMAVGDADGDGHPDFLFGSDLTDFGGTDAGSLYWYTLRFSEPLE